MEKFFIHCFNPPHPLDTANPDQHDFIIIKVVDTTDRVLYLGGEQCHTRLFGTWEKRDEGDTKLFYIYF